MIEIVFAATSIIWMITAIASIVLLWRTRFHGKSWLMAFIAVTLLMVIATPMLAVISNTESPQNSLTYFFQTFHIVSLLCILLFVYKVQANDAEITNMSHAEVSGSTRHSLMPPIWLLGLTLLASGLCLAHNVNGSIFRPLAISLTKLQPGSGGAIGYANQLGVMNTLANIIGTLYIVTIILWVLTVATTVVKLRKNRKLAGDM